MSAYKLHCLRFSLVLRTLRGVSGLLHAEWSRCLLNAGLLCGERPGRSGAAASMGAWFCQALVRTAYLQVLITSLLAISRTNPSDTLLIRAAIMPFDAIRAFRRIENTSEALTLGKEYTEFTGQSDSYRV